MNSFRIIPNWTLPLLATFYVFKAENKTAAVQHLYYEKNMDAKDIDGNLQVFQSNKWVIA